jgi:mRNA interferase MazF
MTSKGLPAPFRVPVTHAAKKGLIVLDQIRTVHKSRLLKRVGAVNTKVLSRALTTLQEVFAE